MSSTRSAHLRPPTGGTPGRRRFRNGVNHVSGYVLGFGLLAFVVGLDPWGLYSERGSANVPVNLEFCSFFGALSVLGYRLFAHPRLDVHPDHLVLVGVTRDISAPLSAVTEVDTTSSSEHVRLRIDGRWRSVPALERRHLDVLRDGSVLEQLTALLPEGGDAAVAADGAGPVRVRLSRPELNEVFLLVAWISYTAAGALTVT